MEYPTIYDVYFSGSGMCSRHSLHEAILNYLKHKHDTDDVHIQEIVRHPIEPQKFIYPTTYSVTTIFVVGRELHKINAQVKHRPGASTLDPDYVRLTTYKPKSK